MRPHNGTYMPRVAKAPDDMPRVSARHCYLSHHRLQEITKMRTITRKMLSSPKQITSGQKLQRSLGRSSCFDLKPKQQLQAHRHRKLIVKRRYFHRKEKFFEKKHLLFIFRSSSDLSLVTRFSRFQTSIQKQT